MFSEQCTLSLGENKLKNKRESQFLVVNRFDERYSVLKINDHQNFSSIFKYSNNIRIDAIEDNKETSKKIFTIQFLGVSIELKDQLALTNNTETYTKFHLFKFNDSDYNWGTKKLQVKAFQNDIYLENFTSLECFHFSSYHAEFRHVELYDTSILYQAAKKIISEHECLNT